MKFNMKWLSVLVMLAVLLMTPALAATAKPVLVMADYKVAPAATISATNAGPLMPGDTGTVIVTIGNTLKSPGTGTTKQETDTQNYYASPASPLEKRTLSTTTSSSDAPSGSAAIKSVILQDNGPVKVVSQPYLNPGSLGMGDSARFEFTISVDQGAAVGKYYLPLTVKTDDDGVYLNQYVPVVVDDSGVRMVISDAPKSVGTGRSSVVIDVINYLPGGVSAVSVLPSGDSFSFKPVQEYTVGSIGANEMYTVTFDVSSRNASYSGSPSFIVKYKNGDNWHQWGPVSLKLDATSSAVAATSDNSGLLILIGGIVLLAVIVGGLFLYMQGKRAKK
ncbi:MAG TPA: hypothetical protein VGJ92_10925 [Methanocella sp.]|jgi:hypothetical protein